MQTSQNGRQMIEGFEGLRLTAYQDQRGRWTIGYGHTGTNVHEGMVWTQAQADIALENDLRAAENAVNTYVTAPLTQNMFDALVSFTYNIGPHALATSTLLKFLNEESKLAAAAQFLRWDHVNGAPNSGLLHRRVAERDLFMKPEAA
jgi:lysozyme